MLFTLHPAARDVKKETYSFKSTNVPSQIGELKLIENDLYSLIHTEITGEG